MRGHAAEKPLIDWHRSESNTCLHCIMNRSLTYFKNAMMHEIELAWMEAFKPCFYVAYA